MSNFAAGQVIKVNGKTFEIVKATPSAYYEGHFELLGTLQGDASFLAGKRTIMSNHLVATKTGFKYDWNAR